MSAPDKPDWSIREMRENEVETVVDGVFRAYPNIERGPPKVQTFRGVPADFSLGGMVREEIASMFAGVRYGLPFQTKTVVAVRGDAMVASASMYNGGDHWQLGYMVRATGDGAEGINKEIAVSLFMACQEWGLPDKGFVNRSFPPWFHV